MSNYTNIAAYHFATLQDLAALRRQLLGNCREWGLKGSILLAPEGINLFIAGMREEVEKLLAFLRGVPGLSGLQVKYSESAHQPFNRMLVRLKKEIIAFGVDGISPAQHTSQKLSPAQLKQWLDEGRKLTLLDTRNDYEVKLGTFENALPIGVDNFRDFPAAVRALPAALKDEPIVMFCTGGIRCEKAGPFMEREGFKQIFQLEGGILKYFEDCGGAHYRGECFVFDQRVGLDPALRETSSAQCFHCLAPLTAEEQDDPRYVAGVSCPHCHRTPEQTMAEWIRDRRLALEKATSPLPGSLPYDNHRPLNIPEEVSGAALCDALATVVKHLPATYWWEECQRGLVLDLDRRPVSPERVVRGGERYLHLFRGVVEPDVNANIDFLHEDEAIVVLNKPAPLPMHAGGRFNRNTLQYLLNQVYAPWKPKPAHRLDANTTGLVVFTRTRAFASRLQPQFVNGTVEKAYLALVSGSPDADEFSCDAPLSAEPREMGARSVLEEGGLSALTDFRVLERFLDGRTLLEARPRTGRTNQIRAHLAHLGLPIVGDQTYLGAGRIGEVQTLAVGAQPLCLHSWKLAFDHPLTGNRVWFEAPAPAWAADSKVCGARISSKN